ncbi:cytochrome c maturation protein CcmE [Vibrio sp. Vb2880]|uniref:Cytochrome c-type biogenesis protein CcmE n=1 Tax=Vibrio furnissii TaxID=29494 RepID=A0A0Q2MI32_VIBFU|nr:MULTISPECIES: cytochrome c maturation protein CcmE [Vibrio]ADT86451.1 cytochrome c-type biogenesis protein CcmE [Vibrio furnissii NCTC 11218]EEX42325.1 cytochrome c-type biogenesis protein CcmE heme chaperone [Vibrio furnissii CIP 102972]KQH87346.1 cytochrome C biogenesis protein CcmE [Vibrio furnissii]MBO0212511.1 cytochrome c maturation protein CcmE [Vibrio sp. Vb2880]MCG6214357.1 cytochrome c maturation protein CcmE [Vibrio furnissii]
MNPRRKKRLGIVLAIFIGLGATIGLVLYALNQNMDLFYTPTELVNGKNGQKPEVGQRLRIGGMVEVGSVKRDPNSLKVSFLLHDTGPSVTVTYEGILPDLFREGQGIVAQGVLKDATTVEAFEVLAKHDEEYMPPEIAEAMEKNHSPMSYSQDQMQGSAK